MRINLIRDSVANGDDFGTVMTFDIASTMSVLGFIHFIRTNFIKRNLWMAKYIVYGGNSQDTCNTPLLVIDTESNKVDVVHDRLQDCGWPHYMYFNYLTPYWEKKYPVSFEVKETYKI